MFNHGDLVKEIFEGETILVGEVISVNSVVCEVKVISSRWYDFGQVTWIFKERLTKYAFTEQEIQEKAFREVLVFYCKLLICNNDFKNFLAQLKIYPFTFEGGDKNKKYFGLKHNGETIAFFDMLETEYWMLSRRESVTPALGIERLDKAFSAYSQSIKKQLHNRPIDS